MNKKNFSPLSWGQAERAGGSVNDRKLQMQEEFSQKISIIFKTDYNINKIHDTVIRKLNYECTDEIKRNRYLLEKEKETVLQPQNYRERKDSLQKIDNLEIKIKEAENKKRYNEYLNKSKNYINAYNKLGPEKKNISFNTGEVEEDPHVSERVEIISNYFSVAGEYILLDIFRQMDSVNECIGCGESLEEVFIDEDGTQICCSCNAVFYHIGVIKGKKTEEKDEYKNGENFHKALLRYACKQTDKTPERLYDALDKYFVPLGKLPGREIRNLPYTEKGKKQGTTIPMLLDALNRIEYEAFYEDVYLIAHKYWGWRKPEIDDKITKIMDHYGKTQEVYKRLPKDRTSSLGTQYRLYQHLRLVNHECDKEDFKIPGDPKSKDFHEATWKAMCDGCDDRDIFYIPL